MPSGFGSFDDPNPFPRCNCQPHRSGTEGQACTAKLGLDALYSDCSDLTGPITFAACDNGVIYDQRKFLSC